MLFERVHSPDEIRIDERDSGTGKVVEIDIVDGVVSGPAIVIAFGLTFEVAG